MRTLKVGFAVLLLTIGATSSANAQPCTPNAGPFCIDGVITPTNNSGLAPGALFTSDPTGVKEFGPINDSLTKVGVINFKAPPMLGDTSMPPKTDFSGVFTQAGVSETDFWFYAAWTRSTTTGSGFLAFEFQRAAKPAVCSLNYDPFNGPALIAGCNPWANRDGDGTPGNSDFMVLWDQTGNTIGPQNIFVRFYNKAAGAFGPPQNLTLAGSAMAVYGNGDSSRGEMALNFSAIVGAEQNECLTFANIIPTTVTGNSDTADYKDTLLSNFPLASNCGVVTVQKITSPESSGIEFQYTLNKTSGVMFGGDVDADCSVTGTTTNCVGALEHNQTDTISNLLQGDYTLIESLKPSNYNLSSIICTPEGGTPVDITAGGNFSVQATKTTACIITNTLATANLRIIKIVQNNFGLTKQPGDFSFVRDAGSAEPFANNGESCVSGEVCKTISYAVGASFSVTEATPLPTGYTKISEVGCSGTMTAAGATCTITNRDTINAPTLFTRMKVTLIDRATIGGIRRGTGEGASSVTIRLYSDATCNTEVKNQVFAIPASGDTHTFETTTGSHTISFDMAIDPEVTQTYRWRAFYSGNNFNSSQSTMCSDERINLVLFQK